MWDTEKGQCGRQCGETTEAPPRQGWGGGVGGGRAQVHLVWEARHALGIRSSITNKEFVSSSLFLSSSSEAGWGQCLVGVTLRQSIPETI